MGFILKLLTTLSVGALCALDAQAEKTTQGPSLKKPIPPGFLSKTSEQPRSQEQQSNDEGFNDDEESTLQPADSEDSPNADFDTPLAPASPGEPVAQDQTTQQNANFSDYLQNLIDELDSKAKESGDADETAADGNTEGADGEVALSEVVADVAEVLAKALEEPAPASFSVQSTGGGATGGQKTTTTTVPPGGSSAASSPFNLITSSGLMVISAAAYLLL